MNVATKGLFWLSFAFCFGGACSPAPRESVASGQEALNTSDSNISAAQTRGGWDTSAAFGSAGSTGPALVVAYTDGAATTPGQVADWAVSTDGGATFSVQRTEALFPFGTGSFIMNDGSPYKGGHDPLS